MNKIKGEMLKLKRWAIVGATNNKEKYGYKIWKLMPDYGYKVFGVNPNYNEIEGQKIYKSLSDIDEKIDVVSVVVNPRLSLRLLDEVKKLGIRYVFFQPRTYNDKVLKKADDLGLYYIIDDCIYATLLRS